MNPNHGTLIDLGSLLGEPALNPEFCWLVFWACLLGKHSKLVSGPKILQS